MKREPVLVLLGGLAAVVNLGLVAANVLGWTTLTPQAVGLADTGTPRRVPGLRREEVAGLVAISTDYYARIEQGRISVSGPVLEAIARVLGLDETQSAYLRELAGRPSVARPRRRAPQRLDPQMRRVLDGLTEWPAMVLGRHLQRVLVEQRYSEQRHAEQDEIDGYAEYLRRLGGGGQAGMCGQQCADGQQRGQRQLPLSRRTPGLNLVLHASPLA